MQEELHCMKSFSQRQVSCDVSC